MKYKIDTLSYDGKQIHVYRTENLTEYIFNGNKNFNLMDQIVNFEDKNQHNPDYVRNGQKVFVTTDLLNDIKKADSNFDASHYIDEINFYKWYNDEISEKETQLKAKNDSIAMVYEANKKEKDIESKRIDDSVLKAQNRPIWAKMNIDSVEFVSRYGSEYEFKSENYFMKNSRNGFRALFIGAKASYINYFFLYLMNKMYLTLSTKENATSLTFKATGYNNEQGFNIRLTGAVYFDKNKRTTSVTITGTPQAIIDIFIDYWENYNLNMNDLKTKKSIYTMNASDKVSFSWKGLNPVITVSKGLINFEYNKNKKLGKEDDR